MPQFLCSQELFEMVQRKSLETKQRLWVCSRDLGADAHQVFSQEILKNTPADIRFVFSVNESQVKKGETSPYEVQYLMEHFGSNTVKSMDGFNANIYIFDDSALITSAKLAKTGFENGVEIGVILEGSEVEDVKNFFDQNLWLPAKPVGDLKKLKQTWNSTLKKADNVTSKKTKPLVQIGGWTDDYVKRWYIAVPFKMSQRNQRKIRKETNWPGGFSVAGDIGYQTFKELKLGDLAYLADFSSKRGKMEIELARVFDKSRVETDEGDLHIAYQTERTYFLEREQFYEMLKNANINSSKTFETNLSSDQAIQIANAVSSVKPKRKKRKTSTPKQKHPKKQT